MQVIFYEVGLRLRKCSTLKVLLNAPKNKEAWSSRLDSETVAWSSFRSLLTDSLTDANWQGLQNTILSATLEVSRDPDINIVLLGAQSQWPLVC